MKNAPIVIIKEGRHKWKIDAERLKSLDLTKERYASLHANFNSCLGIDKMRIIREDPEKEIFAGEVRRWLPVELTIPDRANIYGRANLCYHPGFAMYSTMAYLKSRFMIKVKNAERRILGLAAAADVAAGVENAARAHAG